ncbi:MAG: BamA/TamA family outer membrane protein [Gemmatimonadetes bacterium]|nr:BamA/TamA family outer membrane protein [Gemmatimonadota bacterium]
MDEKLIENKVLKLRACFILAALMVVVPARGETPSDDPIVRWLHISGHRAIWRGELKALMITHASPWYDFLPWVQARRYDPLALASDLEKLRAYYRDLGYLAVAVHLTVEQLSADEIGLGVHITEGPLTRISKTSVIGNEDSENAFGQLEGKPLSRDIVDRSVSRVVSGLRNKGYAFVRAEVETTIVAQQAELVLKLTSGPVCSLGTVHISGNKAVSENTISRGLTFQSGELFNEEALQKSQHLLYRAGVFRSVALALKDSSKNRVDVDVRVSERPFQALRLGAGYDTDEDLWVSGAWIHRNFRGGARQLRLSGRISGKNRETVLGLRQPYFISSNNWLNISGFVQRERQAAFEQDELGGNLSLERNITTTADLIAQFSGGVVDFSADSAFAEMKVGLLIDTRDDIFDPQSGMLAQFAVRERGQFLRSDSEFLQATAEGRWFRRIPLRSVLALRVQGGMIFELGKTGGVPNVERFFAGGLNSVRGWGLNELGPKDHEGNPTGGLSRVEMSMEIRTQIFFSLGTAIFVDVGNVDAKSEAFNPGSLKYAVGAGLRYLSPVGPVRFDVGYRLSDDSTVTKRIQYHISLGQAF